MFELYILMLQIEKLRTLCLGLGRSFKGKMDLDKALKIIASLFWIIATIFAAFIVTMGIITLTVIRTIWKFK